LYTVFYPAAPVAFPAYRRYIISGGQTDFYRGADVVTEPGRCPFCGRDAAGRKFCPFCGGEMPRRATPPLRDKAPTAPLVPAPLLPGQVLPGPVPGEAAPLLANATPPKKRNVALPVVLAVLALLVIGGAVLAVVLLSGGGGVSMSIKSPENGSNAPGNTVDVELEVTNASKVARVDIFLDRKKRATLEAAPYTTELVSLDKGAHELKATAYDSGGSVLAEATSAFESEGGSDTTNGDDSKATAYKAALSPKIGEASSLDGRIEALANRINSEVNFNSRVVGGGLLSDVRALNADVNALAASAAELSPPADMKDIQSQFTTLVSYLQVRAGALLQGLTAVSAGGDHKAAFDNGGVAKTSFDKAWPPFLSACASKGISF
jgi:hypothetical protein